MHVLLTDDSYYSSLGIVRSLGKKGIRVSVLADTPVALASRSRYCSGRYSVPHPGEESYVPAVVSILRRVHFDLVISVGYAATLALAEHKAELNSITKLEVADYEKIRGAADKCYANELATAVGVPAPKMACPASFDEVVQISADFEYPVVIKPANEGPKEAVHYARTRQELLSLYRASSEPNNGRGSYRLMVQEFVPGYGCGFFALYQHGVCKRVFMHRRVREAPPLGGVSCCAASTYDPKLREYGTRLLDRLQWHGVAMVEFRYDARDHDYKLIEINPKFWGSLDLALAAGVDFPFYLCQMAQGQTLEYSEEFDRSLRYHWPLLEMKHLRRRPASIGAVLADCLNPKVKSNISWRDIRPNLLEPSSRVLAQVGRWIETKRRQLKRLPGALTGKVGLEVALLGVDGTGKSSLANALRRLPAPVKVIYMGPHDYQTWIMRFVIKHALPLPFRQLAFRYELLARRTRGWLLARKGWIVIYDRHPAEQLDPGKKSLWNVIKNVLDRLYAWPVDLTFWLTGDYPTLYLRKREYPVADLQLIDRRFQRVLERYAIPFEKIDVTKNDLNSVTAVIRNHILPRYRQHFSIDSVSGTLRGILE
ncbi:MAG: ATP-grasp domain-containing protein [Acidobacteriia bacterium]|nr:ATP-grasp domain-containing protein [Terriglobia bacterium]